MVEMFCSFLFLPCPNRCVFILLPHWTRKATLYLTDQSADAIYSSMPKTPLPASGTCASFLLGNAAS